MIIIRLGEGYTYGFESFCKTDANYSHSFDYIEDFANLSPYSVTM